MTKQELEKELQEILGTDGLEADLAETVVQDIAEPMVAGIVSHPKFEGRELPDRRALIWPKLRERLHERSQFIGTLLLFTPDEYADLKTA